MAQHEDKMVTRLTPPPAARSSSNQVPLQVRAPGFLIEIFGADMTVLVRLREEAGRLVVEGDESRWDEAAKRFLYAMMQWSGLVGLRWKDDVKAAAE